MFILPHTLSTYRDLCIGCLDFGHCLKSGMSVNRTCSGVRKPDKSCIGTFTVLQSVNVGAQQKKSRQIFSCIHTDYLSSKRQMNNKTPGQFSLYKFFMLNGPVFFLSSYYFHPIILSTLPLYVKGFTYLCRSLFFSWPANLLFALQWTFLCGVLVAKYYPEVARFVCLE